MSKADKRDRPTSGPVRILSAAEIARDYPTEASADQLYALRDERDATAAAVERNRGALPADLVAVLEDRIISDGAALAAAGWTIAAVNHGA